ncbi:MAG: hypothetical protein Kow0029_19820 [Candidatus Rifleibacteriota bacterium]
MSTYKGSLAPLVVRILGRSGSGKTTLILEIIRHFADIKTGVIKHSGHYLDMPESDKDTARFARAGAAIVAGLSDGFSEVFFSGKTPLELSDIMSLYKSRADLVLIEGARNFNFPTILIGDAPEGARVENPLLKLGFRPAADKSQMEKVFACIGHLLKTANNS